MAAHNSVLSRRENKGSGCMMSEITEESWR
jgi:hypothetical protein